MPFYSSLVPLSPSYVSFGFLPPFSIPLSHSAVYRSRRGEEEDEHKQQQHQSPMPFYSPLVPLSPSLVLPPFLPPSLLPFFRLPLFRPVVSLPKKRLNGAGMRLNFPESSLCPSCGLCCVVVFGSSPSRRGAGLVASARVGSEFGFACCWFVFGWVAAV